MSKLKIAVFTDTFFPHINGVVSAIYNSTKGLQALGHELIIFAPKSLLKGRKPVQYTNLKAEIIYLPSIPVVDRGLRFSFPFFPVTLLKILKFKPDIIHSHMPLTLGMEAILTAKMLEKPLITTFHTFFMEEEYLKKAKINKLHAERFFSKIGWEYSKLFYNQADVIISPSAYTAKNIKKNGCVKPVVTIPNSIEISGGTSSLSAEASISIRRQFSIPDNNKVIIWLGRLSPEKKLDTAIKAFKLLLHKYPNVTYLLIGDGPERKNLESLAAREIKNKNIVFAGNIDHSLLIKNHIMQIGDAFFSASTSETQCIAALEAMAEGLPLVVDDKRGLPELIDGNGFVCRAEDTHSMAEKLYYLLTNDKQKKKMGQKSRLLSLNYSNEIIAKKLEQLYEKVMLDRLRVGAREEKDKI